MNRLAIDENEANEIIGVEIYSAMGIIHPSNPDFFWFKDHPEATAKTSTGLTKVSEKEFICHVTEMAQKNNHLIREGVGKCLYAAKNFENILGLENHKNMDIHLIYSGNSFNWTDIVGHNVDNDIGPKQFTKWLTEYAEYVLEYLDMNLIFMTFLDMWKHNLVTKETADRCFKGRNRIKSDDIMESVNDDLEKFHLNLTMRPKALLGRKLTYFLPKTGFIKQSASMSYFN